MTILELAREGAGLAGQVETPGPWRAEEHVGERGGLFYSLEPLDPVEDGIVADVFDEGNANYLAHTSQHFPALAQALEEAVGLVKSLRGALDILSDDHNDRSMNEFLDEARAFLAKVGAE